MSHSKQKISANLFNQFFILFNAPKHKQKRISFTYYNDVAVLVMLINATLEEDILKSLFIITQKSYKKYHLLLYAYKKIKTHRYGYMKVKESNTLSLTSIRAILRTYREVLSHKNFNQIYLEYYSELKCEGKSQWTIVMSSMNG